MQIIRMLLLQVKTLLFKYIIGNFGQNLEYFFPKEWKVFDAKIQIFSMHEITEITENLFF